MSIKEKMSKGMEKRFFINRKLLKLEEALASRTKWHVSIKKLNKLSLKIVQLNIKNSARYFLNKSKRIYKNISYKKKLLQNYGR